MFETQVCGFSFVKDGPDYFARDLGIFIKAALVCWWYVPNILAPILELLRGWYSRRKLPFIGT